MEVKAGHIQTEVGIVPTDWEVKTIREIAPLQRGFDLTNSQIKDGPYPVVYSNGVMNFHNKAMVRGPGVVTGRSGTLGNVHYVESDYWPHNTSLWVTRFNRTVPKFIYYLYSSIGFQRFASGSGVPTLNRNDAHSFRTILPTNKAEQEAIANALSDADALIESQERIIAKKRNVKRGAMQELLTGKKRLPGFSGGWTRYKLGELIIDCSSGATPYRGIPQYYKGTIKWITSGELNYNVITETIEHISEEAVRRTNLKIHPVGTFLMAITGLEAEGTRGACAIVGSPATTNQSCMAIYPRSMLKTEYLYHYYVLRGNELALRFCQGTKQQSYTAKLVKTLTIDLPPTVEEQNAVATLLSDMDTAISEAEDKLKKMRQIKQGMAQELLTGRIRLV